MATEVRDDTVIFVDVLEWREPWDFDHPTCILRPVVVYSPNGDGAEEMVESFCETAAERGVVSDDEPEVENGIVDRQFPLQRLKRRWREAVDGKEFPQKGYEATRWRCRFYEVEDLGEKMLHYEITEVPHA